MEIDAFYETMRKTGGYETPANLPRSFFNRLFGKRPVWYYQKIFRVVVSGYRIGRRGEFDNRQWAEHSVKVITAVEDCGGRINISGVNNVLACSGPKVFVSNHMSMAETFIFPSLLLFFGPLSTVVKESLVNYPVFGVIMRAVDPIVVGRHDARSDLKEVLNKGLEMLHKGRSVLIFPQSTRNTDFDIASFNSLGAKLAARAGVPIVPVAIKTDYHGIGRRIRDCGPTDMSKTAYFKFGPPIHADGNGREAHEKVIAFMMENLRLLGVNIREQKTKAE
jgi:1-acyl-sn-glycerol-3-phosphate acyltransferase